MTTKSDLTTPMPFVTTIHGDSTPTSFVTSGLSSGGAILYVENGQIWQLDIDINQTKQLTFDKGRSSKTFTPKWSPDGRKFAYERYGNLWLGNKENDIRHEIVTQINGFWWINISTFRYCQQKETDILCFLFDIETNTTKAIQTDDYWIFAYSPDVSNIFVQEFQTTAQNIQPQTIQYILDVKTRQRVFEYQTGEGFWTEDPQWSPDGSKVAFTASLSDYATSGEIFVIDADGEKLMQLSNFSKEDSSSIFPTLLQWSPNGEWLALVIAKRESNELAILKSDGSVLKQLGVEWVTQGGSNLPPVWSPNSQQIAFLSNQLDNDMNTWQVYTIDVQSGKILQLTNTSGRKTWLDWK